jgi:hypothetical protein
VILTRKKEKRERMKFERQTKIEEQKFEITQKN